MNRFFSTLVLVAVLLGACAPTAAPQATPAGASAASTQASAAAGNTRTLTVMTHDSFAATQSVIQAFESANNVTVQFVKSGDAGAALNKAILTKNAPIADVFYGVDNTFLSRALDADIYQPYASPLLANIPDQFKLDPQNRALPVDYGDVCINYDKAYYSANNIPLPQTLDDLTNARYIDQLVTENPATSSTGLAFLLATVAKYGDPGYLDYWKALKANGVVVVDGWETAYYTNFSGSTGKGPQPMVVSYASSPAAEVVYASPPRTDSPIGSILDAGTCFRQIEFVGILKGTKNLDLAQKFVDFMLGVQFQEDMPLQMYVYPVNQQAKLPDAFVKYAQVATGPATLPPADIAANRDKWIQAWSDLMLK